MEPRQHKQRLRPNGGITAADKLRAPRVVRSLKIFLDSWWSLKREEVTSGKALSYSSFTESYKNKRRLCEWERRLMFWVFLGIAVNDCRFQPRSQGSKTLGTRLSWFFFVLWYEYCSVSLQSFYIKYFGDCIRPRNYLFFNWKKIRLTSYVTFRLDCKRIVGNFGWDSAVNHSRKFSWGSNELSSCENKPNISQYTQFIKTNGGIILKHWKDNRIEMSSFKCNFMHVREITGQLCTGPVE